MCDTVDVHVRAMTKHHNSVQKCLAALVQLRRAPSPPTSSLSRRWLQVRFSPVPLRALGKSLGKLTTPGGGAAGRGKSRTAEGGVQDISVRF